MKKVKLAEHNFRRVLKSLLEMYEPMSRGQENHYNYFFQCIDSNMLKLHRKDSSQNSRRAREAVDICLASINGYLNDLEYDLSEFGNPANLALAKAMQMAFDPYVNPEILPLVSKRLDSREGKKKYFEIPFKCLYRLRDSIDFWIQMNGSDGYFVMVEGEIGATVPYDDKMDFVAASFK